VHSSGTLTANGTTTLGFFVPPNDLTDDTLILLFTGGQLQLSLAGPVSGPAPRPVAPGSGNVTQTIGSNTVSYIAGVGSTQITISPTTTGAPISSGPWTVTLTETTGTATTYDMYIRTSHVDPFPVFNFANRTADKTVNTPGTARNAITVGGFASTTRDLYPTSSRGPTRATDGRQKRDICAPSNETNPFAGIVAPMGLNSLSARKKTCCCDCCENFYVAMDGTSMAAPHVTGVAALLLEIEPALTFSQIRDTMRQTATNPSGVTLPNNDWGYGAVDALAHAGLAGRGAAQALARVDRAEGGTSSRRFPARRNHCRRSTSPRWPRCSRSTIPGTGPTLRSRATRSSPTPSLQRRPASSAACSARGAWTRRRPTPPSSCQLSRMGGAPGLASMSPG
jgi:Subtilase family